MVKNGLTVLQEILKIKVISVHQKTWNIL